MVKISKSARVEAGNLEKQGFSWGFGSRGFGVSGFGQHVGFFGSVSYGKIYIGQNVLNYTLSPQCYPSGYAGFFVSLRCLDG